MRIFLTGATGYIGSAVLETLMRGGHQVTALVRHAGKARRMQKLGAKGVVGDLCNGAGVEKRGGRSRRVHPHGVRGDGARG